MIIFKDAESYVVPLGMKGCIEEIGETSERPMIQCENLVKLPIEIQIHYQSGGPTRIYDEDSLICKEILATSVDVD